MDFNAWLDKAWNEHAEDSAGVAARLEAEGAPLAGADGELAALARLAHHVFGEHLGRHAEGRGVLARLATHAAAGAASAAAVRVLDASLALCDGEDLRAALADSDRIRVAAFAAGTLAGRDTARAAGLLREALAAADAAALADGDPAVRALAVTGNNLACTLEEKRERSEAERQLMILAARTARQYWARAGTWLETERAEYRLARTFTVAGDLAAARRHAQACLEIVRANGDLPLEAFFGWEALGLVEAAAGNATGHAQALAMARAALERLEPGDRAWCEAELHKLAAASVAPTGSAAS